MMTTAIRRVIRAGFVGFWRSAYVSIAAIFTLTVALFVIGSTMFLDQLLTTSLSVLQSKVDINVYFVPEAPQEEIDRLLAAVKTLPEVDYVKYTSREDALEEYRLENQNNEIAMQALEMITLSAPTLRFRPKTPLSTKKSPSFLRNNKLTNHHRHQ
jgi:cell division transport system permease protein